MIILSFIEVRFGSPLASGQQGDWEIAFTANQRGFR
jgi:hypothetical protein